MTNIHYRLEPFDEPTLACIRNAYRQAWPHVCPTSALERQI
jgi:hypothetical protein